MDMVLSMNQVAFANAGMHETRSAQSALAENVRIALRTIPGLAPGTITIVDTDGMIELYGSMPEGVIADAVLSAAESVPGVTFVVSNLVLHSPGASAKVKPR